MDVLTRKERIGGWLNAAERELAYLKSQPSSLPEEIKISERQVQQLRQQYSLLLEAEVV